MLQFSTEAKILSLKCAEFQIIFIAYIIPEDRKMRQFRKPENFRNFTEFANLISDFLRLLFPFLFAILTKFMVSSALIAKHSPRDFLVIVLTLLFSLLIPFPSLSDSLYLLSCLFLYYVSLSIYFVVFSQFLFLTFSFFLVSSNFQPCLSPSLRPY